MKKFFSKVSINQIILPQAPDVAKAMTGTQDAWLLFFFIISTTITMYATPIFDEAWVQSTLASMTLQEKIGQLFIAPAVSDEMIMQTFTQQSPYNTDKEYVEMLIADYHVGGVIFLGNNRSPRAQVDTTYAFQQLSKVPLLIGLDAEWGLSMRLTDSVSYPKNNILGELSDTHLIADVAHEIGRQLSTIGVHINFAPVIDVNSNPNNPIIGARSFGSNPELVAQNGIAFMRGLESAGILACPKHFPGHGDTSTDSHHTLPVINHPRDRLDAIELYPFKKLINAGARMIMTAHLGVPALERDIQKPASLSSTIVTDLLKNELGFTGLVVTDGLGMRGARMLYEPGELELHAVLAGNDIILCPISVPKAIKLIEQAIHDGFFSEQELNKRVEKILRAKAWAFSCNPHSLTPVYDRQELHTAHAYELQTRCNHRQSMVTNNQLAAGH